MEAVPTHRRFRRRLWVVMMALGLVPLLAWGLVSLRLTSEVLSLRPARLDPLLSRIDERLAAGQGQDDALRKEVAVLRMNLAQVELARRSLVRLLPGMLVATVVVSALLVALGATLLGRQLARPLELLAEGMARYARGELSHRLPQADEARGDELQLLMRQFNRMGDELAAQRARLEVTESLAAWRGVARALAHELKNPLTAMRLAVGRLRRRGAGSPGAGVAEQEIEALALIEGQIETLLRLAQSFSSFAKLPSPDPRPTELGPLLREVCALYRLSGPVPVECDAPGGLVLAADGALLRQALGNLVKNALEASSGGGAPVRVSAVREGGRLRVEVSDGGRGIGRVLEGTALAQSLGSSKREGSGLGLPIAHKIVHEHGGALRLEPRGGGGTTATVLLPLESRA